MNMNLKTQREHLAAKQKELADFLAGTKKDGQYSMTQEHIDQVKAMNLELNDLADSVKNLADVEAIAQNVERLKQESRIPSNLNFEDLNEGEQNEGSKSLGELFVSSSEFKNRGKGHLSVDFNDYDLKTTMTTSAGFAPANNRTNIVIPFATRRALIQEYIPQITTTLGAIPYMEETTFTNNTAATTEGSALGESALQYTERTENVQLVGTFLPVTDQQLEDVPGIQGLIDSRLRLMYDLKEEDQILSGSGVSPQLTGIYNKSGIQTQAKGADPTPDAIFKAITKVQHTGFADATLVVMHPNDWQDVRLLRTADGLYIWGNPSEPGPQRIWGVPVVSTTAATENTAILGDFNLYSTIHRRKGATVEVGYNSDDFTKYKRSLRIGGRLAFIVYRASAFCTVTGI